MVAISLAWIPFIDHAQGGQLYLYIQSIAAYLAPPIAAVYTLAVLWARMNEAVCGRLAEPAGNREPESLHPDGDSSRERE